MKSHAERRFRHLVPAACSPESLNRSEQICDAHLIRLPGDRVQCSAYLCAFPIAYPVNMPDPIRIRSGSAWKHCPEARSGPDDSCTPACFRTGSVWPKHNQPELNRLRAGLAQYYPGRLWKNGTESESGKLVAGRLCSASESFTPACLRTRFIWPKPDQATRTGFAQQNHDPGLHWKNGRLDLASTTQPDSGCTLAITGHNQTASESERTFTGLSLIHI